MDYRSILVHLDNSPRCPLRTTVSARLAREHGAHLLGLAPTGRVNLPARVTPSRTGTPNYLELAQARLDAQARACVEAFRQRVAALELESFEGRIDEEEIVESVVAHGRGTDLIVLGQVEPASAGDALGRDLPQQAFLQTGRPVLVVPRTGDFERLGSNIVVAWNDTRESARAVHDALPFLRKAQQVHLMCFGRTRDTRHVSRLHLNDLIRMLARHGVESQLHQEAVQVDVGAALLSRAGDLSADLIAMGGYGRSRVAEFVLGGVTRKLLARATLPVLYSH